MVLRDRDTDADRDVFDGGGSERLWVVQDQENNVRMLVDTNFQPVEIFTFPASRTQGWVKRLLTS